MGEQVERVQTNVPRSQMVASISRVWGQMFQEAPTQEQIALIMAQNALETGNREYMWNYNVGNIKANPEGPYDYFYLHAPEQTSEGHWEKLTMPFRAYDSLDAGVKDYITLLSKSQRYGQAWQHILEPDPVAFSKALKAGGYYTANEADYTKLLSNLYHNYTNTKPPAKSDSDSEEDQDQDQEERDFLSKFWKNNPSFTPSSPANDYAISPAEMQIMDQFLHYVAASEKLNKKIYKKYLPTNNIVIQIVAEDYINSVEFARILCAVLDEELLSCSFPYTDGKNVEIECSIRGPQSDCFEAVRQITKSAIEAFKMATTKIGSLDVGTNFIMNKKSSYQQIDLDVAASQYRKFLLKFI